MPWTILWSLYTGGVCFLIKIPVTDMSVRVMKCFNSAGNLVSFHDYFHMFILAVIGDSFRILRMEFFSQYPFYASMNYGSDTTQSKRMQVYQYSVDVHSRYYGIFKSYTLYRLLSIFYQTMGGYIKFQFYVRAVVTLRWFTVNYTLHVQLVVTLLSSELVPTVLWSVGILLTQLWYLWFSPAMHSSWTVSLVIGVKWLVWTDAYALLNFLKYVVYERSLDSERVADYVVKHYDTRNQIFKNADFYMLLRQFPPYTVVFTK
ncbi:hypothetical protein MKW92_037406, partial [Papaver armeniacum]